MDRKVAKNKERFASAISFEVDEKFMKFVHRRAGSLGTTVSDMVRNAIIFDALFDCDGEAYEMLSSMLSDRISKKSISALTMLSSKLKSFVS
jgi:hypothetical protein